MNAIQVQADGSLIYKEVSDPVLKSGSEKVKVHAAGVNRADLLQAQGNYPPPEGSSSILGLEVSGTIEAISEDVTDWEVGDRVMALLPGGGYATQVVVPESLLLPFPEAWDFEQAAAIPEAIYTAYLNLCYLGQLCKGETVLIHAGAGGIGSMAIQLAKTFGADVISTAGTNDKVSFCQELGADLALNYRIDDLKDSILDFMPSGVDIVLDPIGDTKYASLHTKVLKRYGQWLLIGLLGDTKAELNMGRMLAKNLLLKGSTLRYQSLDFKIHLTQLIKAEIIPLLNSKTLTPCLDLVFPMADAEEAHAYLRANKTKGKVILTP